MEMGGKLNVEIWWGDGVPVFLRKKKRSTSTNLHSEFLAETGMKATSKYLNHGWVKPKRGTSSNSPILTPHPGTGGRRVKGTGKGVEDALIPPNLSVNDIIFPPDTSVLPITAAFQ